MSALFSTPDRALSHASVSASQSNSSADVSRIRPGLQSGGAELDFDTVVTPQRPNEKPSYQFTPTDRLTLEVQFKKFFDNHNPPPRFFDTLLEWTRVLIERNFYPGTVQWGPVGGHYVVKDAAGNIVRDENGAPVQKKVTSLALDVTGAFWVMSSFFVARQFRYDLSEPAGPFIVKTADLIRAKCIAHTVPTPWWDATPGSAEDAALKEYLRAWLHAEWNTVTGKNRSYQQKQYAKHRQALEELRATTVAAAITQPSRQSAKRGPRTTQEAPKADGIVSRRGSYVPKTPGQAHRQNVVITEEEVDALRAATERPRGPAGLQRGSRHAPLAAGARAAGPEMALRPEFFENGRHPPLSDNDDADDDDDDEEEEEGDEEFEDEYDDEDDLLLAPEGAVDDDDDDFPVAQPARASKDKKTKKNAPEKKKPAAKKAAKPKSAGKKSSKTR